MIPKKHYPSLSDLPPDELARCTSVFQKMARQIARALKASGFNLIQNNGEAAGQSIGHVHFHIIPRFQNDGYITSWSGEPASSDRLEEVRKEISREPITFSRRLSTATASDLDGCGCQGSSASPPGRSIP